MNHEEKRAFEAMMAEIDSESDEEERGGQRTIPVKSAAKQSEKGNFYAADAKNVDNYGSSSNQRVEYKSQGNKMSKEEQEIANFGSNYHQSPADAQLEQINTTKRWLARPFSKGERSTMKCYVERERQSFGMQTIYRCFLEGSNDGQQARFMMSAKKIVGKKTSYYLLSLDQNPTDDRGSETVIGKVRGNAVGSKYIVSDHGLAPDKTVAPSMLRKELGMITFQFDSGGPSRIEAWIPSVSSSGVATVWQPDADDNGMEQAIESSNNNQLLLCY
jgi:hypothetical protein